MISSPGPGRFPPWEISLKNSEFVQFMVGIHAPTQAVIVL